MSKLKLSTDRLTVGLYIKLPCTWGGHPFLFSSFKIQDEDQIQVLQSLSFNHVFYLPEKVMLAHYQQIRVNLKI